MRKIHLNGKVYQYRIGKGYAVIEFPGGVREIVSVFFHLPRSKNRTLKIRRVV